MHSAIVVVVSTEDALLEEVESRIQRYSKVVDIRLLSQTKLLDFLSEHSWILLLPSCDLRFIGGVSRAVEILRNSPTLETVSGFVLSPQQEIASGGFRLVSMPSEFGILLDRIEEDTDSWKKDGEFASHSVVGPTLFCVARGSSLPKVMIEPLAPMSRAIAQAVVEGRPGENRHLVHSGLVAHITSEVPPVILTDHQIEVLPASTHALWKEMSIRMVRVLHQGYAVRDDALRRIVIIGDPWVRAVDGMTIRPASQVRDWALSDHFLRQLGPGFLQQLGPAAIQRSDRTGTSREEELLKFARKVHMRLPAWVDYMVDALVRAVNR